MYKNKIVFPVFYHSLTKCAICLGLVTSESIMKQPRHCAVSCHRHEVQFSAGFPELCLDFDAWVTKLTYLIFVYVFR